MRHVVLVCGGRDFDDDRHLSDTLCGLHSRRPITLVVHGAASGADTMAAGWAWDMGVPVEAVPADWNKHGRAAGPIRNQKMLDEYEPDVVIAFPGGRGTRDMMTRAKASGYSVVEILPRTPQATDVSNEAKEK